MAKDTRTAELRNAGSRQLSALLTTIQRLHTPDALDLLRETLRRCAERSREILLSAQLTEMIEARHQDLSKAADEWRARNGYRTNTGST